MIYFAYGSNLDTCQIAARCPSHEFIGVARLPSFRLVFSRRSEVRNCAVASIEPAAGETVWGVTFRLCDADATVLHRFEGYDPDRCETENRYLLRPVTVLAGEQAEPVAALAYVANPTSDPGLPSADYLGHLVRGAIHHGLPQDWIERLRGVITAEMRGELDAARNSPPGPGSIPAI